MKKTIVLLILKRPTVNWTWNVGTSFRSSSQAIVVRKNLDCRKFWAVATVVEYQQVLESVQWSHAEGSEFLFPRVQEGGERGELAQTPAQMTANLRNHLRAADTEDKWYTIQSLRVGGATSHNMDGTAMDVLMEYVVWKSATVAHRQVRVTSSGVAAGVKRSRETAFIVACALPLCKQFARSHGPTEAESTRGQGRSLGIIRTTRNPRER